MVGGCIDRRQLENHFHICGIDQRRQQIQSIAYRSAEADDDGGGWLRRRRRTVEKEEGRRMDEDNDS